MRAAAIITACALLSSAGADAMGPPQEVHTGTNTNRETSQPHYGAGAEYPGAMEAQPTDQALMVGRDMARCQVSKNPKKVQNALDTSSVDDFRVATHKLLDSLEDCLGYSGKNLADFANFEFAPHALAGLLAEALLLHNGVPQLAAAKYDANAPKLDWMAGSPGSLVELRLGECLSQTQPAAVAALVGSAPSSPQELAAFQNLVPFIPACLDKNVTLKATRSSLRLALAFALYRRTTEPQAGQGTAP